MVLRPCQASKILELNEVKELDEDKIYETFEKLDWPRTVFLEDLQKRTTTIYWEPTIIESKFETLVQSSFFVNEISTSKNFIEIFIQVNTTFENQNLGASVDLFFNLRLGLFLKMPYLLVL